jgi:hypothetical protein
VSRNLRKGVHHRLGSDSFESTSHKRRPNTNTEEDSGECAIHHIHEKPRSERCGMAAVSVGPSRFLINSPQRASGFRPRFEQTETAEHKHRPSFRPEAAICAMWNCGVLGLTVRGTLGWDLELQHDEATYIMSVNSSLSSHRQSILPRSPFVHAPLPQQVSPRFWHGQTAAIRTTTCWRSDDGSQPPRLAPTTPKRPAIQRRLTGGALAPSIVKASAILR